ncbi:hypothetical protein B9Z55_001608 [Caenorhabditis nigoni]|uniref:Uncharacterized protein n=1 Tax=Caenorhabditis nigoni TaxID=1611254 RepID=A0A2G5VGJ4_9PELO|nr:hypothetical protein B9Z55_001608 [Caenorhabditis nigoni]
MEVKSSRSRSVTRRSTKYAKQYLREETPTTLKAEETEDVEHEGQLVIARRGKASSQNSRQTNESTSSPAQSSNQVNGTTD